MIPTKTKTVNTNSFIKNSCAWLEIYHEGSLEVPVVKEANKAQNRCYITSLVTQYISYVEEEVLKSPKYPKRQKILAKYLSPLFIRIARLAKMDEITWVNNALVSTPLYGDEWNALEVEDITLKILKSHPNQVIIYRSVDPVTNPVLFGNLKSAGFIPLMGRQIYIFDPKNSKYQKKRSFQMDKKLAEKQNSFYWTLLDQQNEKDIVRSLELYKKLYLDKHSVYNPIYTKEFVKNGIGISRLRYEVLKEKKTDQIVAVQGIHETETVINTSFIGYDQTLPREYGLYRLMNYEMMRQAIEKEKILNMSSGAGDFKSKRGGIASFEYQMIYPGNLSLLRQRIWQFVGNLLERSFKPQMQYLKI